MPNAHSRVLQTETLITSGASVSFALSIVDFVGCDLIAVDCILIEIFLEVV